ncbi:MAG: DUF4365 domain-containing protein, partial [Anaerolineae bacterium]|nr:DUF4365 domain-containing protein [Anaerolineae bacterium]
IELPTGKFMQSSTLFHCQLKATTTCEIQSDTIVYDMEVEAYNKMVSWDGGHFILVLFVMPEDETEWLKLDEDGFLLKKCCYWIQIEGSLSENRRSQRVFIPRTQLFTPATVRALLEEVKRETHSK